MSRNSPSYITKTKHGVYYFQLRVTPSVAISLGINSLLYRKSLRTKDKNLALKLARRLWSKIYVAEISENTLMTKNNYTHDDILGIQDEMYEESRMIRVALEVHKKARLIPDWDYYSQTQLKEFMSSEEEQAMLYVAKKNINLDDYLENSHHNIEVRPSKSEATHTFHSKKLSTLLDSYLSESIESGIRKKSVATYKGQLNVLIDLLGDKESTELTIDDIDLYVKLLNKLPSNRKKTKPYRDMTIHEIMEMDIPDEDIAGPKTKHDHAQRVRAFLEWAKKRRFLDEYILVPLDGKFMKTDSIPYAQFSNEDLEKLFYTEGFLSRKGFKYISYYWIPLLALFTGARLNELCQISIDDVKSFMYKNKKHYYIDINDEGDRELKTKASVRKVPLHKEIIKLGFIDYVESQKKKGESDVFTDLNHLSGTPSKKMSRWFNETYKKKCGIENDGKHRKVFHSFRHTLVDHLYQLKLGIGIDRIGDIAGHTHKTVTGKSYVSKDKLNIENRMDVIEKINYELDFSKLKKLDYS